jgi:hypothetical protein
MKFKKILRILGLIFLILLALSGIGPPPPRFSRHFDNEIKIELVEQRQEDENEDSEKEARD